MEWVQCSGCALTTVLKHQCVHSSTSGWQSSSSSTGAVTNVSLVKLERLKDWVLWTARLLLDDFFDFLYQCDACGEFFCSECVVNLVGDCRFCQRCTSSHEALKRVLQHKVFSRDADIWRHAGRMLKNSEEITIVKGSKRGPVAKVMNRRRCLAKAFTISQDMTLWPEIAASMEWSETITFSWRPSAKDATQLKLHLDDDNVQSSLPVIEGKSLLDVTMRSDTSRGVGSLTMPAVNVAVERFTFDCRDAFTTCFRCGFDGDAVTWCNLGVAMPDDAVFSYGGRTFNSVDCFRRARELDPTNVEAKRNEARWLCKQSNAKGIATEKSLIHDIIDVLKGNPTDGEMWSILADALDRHSSHLCEAPPEVMAATRCLSASVPKSEEGDGIVSRVTALRLAATLCFTDESIFQLAMGLDKGRCVMLETPLFDGHRMSSSNGIEGYVMSRGTVLEALTWLHLTNPHFRMSSAKFSFAVSLSCQTSPLLGRLNSRFLITDRSLQGADPDPSTLARASNLIPRQSKKFVLEARLGSTPAVRLTVGIACDAKRAESGVVIGSGAQGVVLKAVGRLPCEGGPGADKGPLALLAVKCFLLLCPTKSVSRNAAFEHMVSTNGDLKLLLSERNCSERVRTRFAVGINLRRHMHDLSNSTVRPLSQQVELEQCVPMSRFVTEVAFDSPLDDSVCPFLIMIFMDRAFCSLHDRVPSLQSHKRLPSELVAVVFAYDNAGAGLRDDDTTVPPSVTHECSADLEDMTRLCNTILLEDELRYFVFYVVCHLQRLHGRGFSHGDVKPGNILLMEDGSVKLADFGLSRREGDVSAGTTYFPPFPSTAAGPDDVWALGMSMRFLLSKVEDTDVLFLERGLSSTFASEAERSTVVDVGKLLDDTVRRRREWLSTLGVVDPCAANGGVSDECRDFLTRCLHPDPSLRATCKMLAGHRFLKKFAEFLEKPEV